MIAKLSPQRLLTLVVAVSLSACASVQMNAAKVTALNPTPSVDLPTSKNALEIEIDPSVKNDFIIPDQNGITAVPVEQWHQSLEAGFKNGLAKYYAPKTAKPDSWKLVILKADLDYVPTAMFAKGARVVGAAAVVARLRYMTRLVSPKGEIVDRSQDEVFSTTQWTEKGGSSITATETLNAMYENVAKQILAAQAY